MVDALVRSSEVPWHSVELTSVVDSPVKPTNSAMRASWSCVEGGPEVITVKKNGVKG